MECGQRLRRKWSTFPSTILPGKLVQGGSPSSKVVDITSEVITQSHKTFDLFGVTWSMSVADSFGLIFPGVSASAGESVTQVGDLSGTKDALSGVQF